jgi:hypothetical protein
VIDDGAALEHEIEGLRHRLHLRGGARSHKCRTLW